MRTRKEKKKFFLHLYSAPIFVHSLSQRECLDQAVFQRKLAPLTKKKTHTFSSLPDTSFVWLSYYFLAFFFSLHRKLFFSLTGPARVTEISPPLRSNSDGTGAVTLYRKGLSGLFRWCVALYLASFSGDHGNFLRSAFSKKKILPRHFRTISHSFSIPIFFPPEQRQKNN